MSQATLGESPYINSDLFSGHYLDTRVEDLNAWDCDAEAREALDELERLWQGESDLVATYNEDQLLDHWIDEVLDVLGFGKQPETALPDRGGFVDKLLFESDDAWAAALDRYEGAESGLYVRASVRVAADPTYDGADSPDGGPFTSGPDAGTGAVTRSSPFVFTRQRHRDAGLSAGSSSRRIASPSAVSP
ncbi:MAG: hypothetical protein ABEH58_06630 [Haloplanus sp.]